MRILCTLTTIAMNLENSKVGIDTGIKDLAILSDGKVYENIKTLKTNLKKLKYEQRQLSKKVKGSNSRLKQKSKLATVHEKVTNIRKDYLHKVSTEIIKNHDVICIEDLAVKNMMKNHKLVQHRSQRNVSLSGSASGVFIIIPVPKNPARRGRD